MELSFYSVTARQAAVNRNVARMFVYRRNQAESLILATRYQRRYTSSGGS